MDFIVNHSGFFLGIGITILLALIGYYADKKDSDKNKNIDSSSESTALDELSSDSENISNISNGVVTDSVLLQDGHVTDSNSVGVESDSNSNFTGDFSDNVLSGFDFPSDVLGGNASVIPDLNNVGQVGVDSSTQGSSIPFSTSDFENINMSLEDLEKKNFENLAINSTGFDDSDNYYYSSLDDFNDLSDDVSDIESNNSVSEDLSYVDSYTSSDDFEVGHEFDSEVQSDSINNSVPEMFENGNLLSQGDFTSLDENLATDSVTEPSTVSSDEDIWKF